MAKKEGNQKEKEMKAKFEDPIPYAVYKYIEELEEENEQLHEKYARLCAEVYVSDRPLTEGEKIRGKDAVRRYYEEKK